MRSWWRGEGDTHKLAEQTVLSACHERLAVGQPPDGRDEFGVLSNFTQKLPGLAIRKQSNQEGSSADRRTPEPTERSELEERREKGDRSHRRIPHRYLLLRTRHQNFPIRRPAEIADRIVVGRKPRQDLDVSFTGGFVPCLRESGKGDTSQSAIERGPGNRSILTE